MALARSPFFKGFSKLLSMVSPVELPWMSSLIPWNDLRPNLLASSGSKAHKAVLCIECVKQIEQSSLRCAQVIFRQRRSADLPLKGLMQCQNLWLQGQPLFLPRPNLTKAEFLSLTIRLSFSPPLLRLLNSAQRARHEMRDVNETFSLEGRSSPVRDKAGPDVSQ